METELFDVDDYETAGTTDVVIRHPETGASTPLVITIAGPEHPVRRQAALARARRMRNQLQRTGKVQLGDPEDDVTQQTDDLVAFTLGWRGMCRSGVDVPHSAAESRKVYTNDRLAWLRAQVVEALDQTERFIKRSETA